VAYERVKPTYTVELHLSGSPIIRMGLSLRVYMFLLQLYYILLGFDVFLTVHHSIDFSKYQLSAQLF